MRGRKDYNYYIFVDYSDKLIGYNIIKKKDILLLLPKIAKLRHYRNLKHKREYLRAMKKLFIREKIDSLILRSKILQVRNNLDIFTEVLEFIKNNNDCIIFVSVDDFQFKHLKRLLNVVDGDNTDIIQESSLKKGTPEYKMSLIIDTKLNIKRRKEK
jgi:hypothetical protein